jgi:hypothetical protein
MWGALSDERTGLSFVYAAGPCQRCLAQVRVPWDSRPYFTVSDLRLRFSSPPTNRRVTVEVFDPASTRVTQRIHEWTLFYNSGRAEERSLPLTVHLLLSVPSVAMKRVSSWQRFDFSKRVRCRETCVNLMATLWFLQAYSLLRTALLASRCLAMNYSGFQASCQNTNDALR